MLVQPTATGVPAVETTPAACGINEATTNTNVSAQCSQRDDQRKGSSLFRPDVVDDADQKDRENRGHNDRQSIGRPPIRNRILSSLSPR